MEQSTSRVKMAPSCVEQVVSPQVARCTRLERPRRSKCGLGGGIVVSLDTNG